LPDTHCVHTPPLHPLDPASQTQAVFAELPAGEVLEAGQAEHVVSAVAPTAGENLPATQSTHAAASVVALYFPATHAVQDI
jgi:hypothetical protein